MRENEELAVDKLEELEPHDNSSNKDTYSQQ